MKEYKKKSRKKLPVLKGKRKTYPKMKNDTSSNDIVMSKSAIRPKKTLSGDLRDEMHLVVGTKSTKQFRRLISMIALCVLLVGVVLFTVLTPTGPFEYINNAILRFGNGSYPASLSGSELLDAYSVDGLTYTLTDSHAEIFNRSGKQLFSRQHEFNAPALAVSSQRAIIYDQGGKKLYVYNHSDVISEMILENEIYCADIGRNGTVAVATRSTGYASEVHVFNKNGKTKYIWYSSDETVNNVAVSDAGNRIAVSTLNVSGGEYMSKVYVFKFSSADPILSFEYDNTIIYSLESSSRTCFSVVTDDTIDYIHWKKGTRAENKNDYTLNIFRDGSTLNVAVAGNKSRNNIKVFDKKGAVLTEFDFDGAVSDACAIKEVVYLISDGYLYTLDYNGKSVYDNINVLSFGRVFALDESSVVAVGNFGLDKFEIK